MKKINLAISGCMGRMGQQLIKSVKKNKIFNTKSQTPGLGNVPVLGNLFKGRTNSDSMDELLIFIAPRIL